MGVETIYDIGRTSIDCGGTQTANGCSACSDVTGNGTTADDSAGSGCGGDCTYAGGNCSHNSFTESIFMQSCLVGTDLGHITILDNRIWHNVDDTVTTTPPSLPDAMFIVDKAAK